MLNLYPKNKKTKAVILYGCIALSSILFAFIQIKIPQIYTMAFLSVFLLMVITVIEIFNVKIGIFTAILVTLLEVARSNFIFAVCFVLSVIFYFIIRILRNQKLDLTLAREKHFRSLVDVSLQPMILKNDKGEVLFASESIKDLLGINKKMSVGKNIIEFIHPDDTDSYNKFLVQTLERPNIKTSIEIRLKTSKDSYIWTRNDAINLLKHPDVHAIVSSWQDITLQKTVDFQKSELLKNEKDARAIAEKAVRDRDEFLSIASHELKTPLTTVLLQLQATLRKILTQSLADFSGRDLLDSLQIAEKQSLSLSTLIKDLLNVSLASTGRLTLNKEAVNLPELVESLAKKYIEEIKLSGCTVNLKLNDDNIVGNWDPVRLEQAITNLLMNALKYAQGKTINMETFVDNNFAVFKISDNGVGIPEEMQRKIFEPFQRANGNSSVRGLGVGLFITKQIATSHEGSIQVESKLGKGTTFILKLPMAKQK